MLEIKNLSKRYGLQFALSNVSLSFERGEIVGIFGQNGAGKTTLMKSILGYIRHSGDILLDGEPISRKNIETLSFATCEHSFFGGLTAAGHGEFYQEYFPKFRKKRFEALLTFFELPKNKEIRNFSTGQKNQFEVILALSQGADYILMDEPFAGNDIFNREDFYKTLLAILEPQETILLSTHLIEEVQFFISRAVLLKSGAVIGDKTTEALEQEGKTLIGYVKEAHEYESDRVSKALFDLTGED